MRLRCRMDLRCSMRLCLVRLTQMLRIRCSRMRLITSCMRLAGRSTGCPVSSSRMRLIRGCCRAMLTGRCMDRLTGARYHRRRCMSLRIEPVTVHRIHRGSRRPAIIDRSKLVTIPAGRLLVCRLFGSCLDMPFPNGRLLLRRRTGSNPSGTSVKGSTIVNYRSIVHYDRAVDIGIVYYGGIDIHYGGVIPERSSFPTAPSETGASVSISIVYAAIETDMGSPITCMPSINASGIPPIRRRPQVADHWRAYPNTGYPVISIHIIIGPVTGCP